MFDFFDDMNIDNMIKSMFGFSCKRKYNFKKRKFKKYRKQGLFEYVAMSGILPPLVVRTTLRVIKNKLKE